MMDTASFPTGSNWFRLARANINRNFTPCLVPVCNRREMRSSGHLLGFTCCILNTRRGTRYGQHEAWKTSAIVCSSSKRSDFSLGPPKKEKSTKTKYPRKSIRTPMEPSKVNFGEPKAKTEQTLERASTGGKSDKVVLDKQFLEKLEAVRRSARDQKKAEDNNLYQAIDYDSGIESEKPTVGFGNKVGVGMAVLVFGLVFAFGDFLPSESFSPSGDSGVVEKKLAEKEKAALETKLQQYEATLNFSPKDLEALEGAAVTSVELGQYEEASSFLGKLIKERPKDMEANRLLGDVKYALRDYEASGSAYRVSLSASDGVDFDALRGLTNSLLAVKKPYEAVQVLLSSRARLNAKDLSEPGSSMDAASNQDKKMQKGDPVLVELLLGKAYSDWGHVSDAIAVYDQLISSYPNDFRGYLAKGIILKENGKSGEADRMFIQARFFAPEKAKGFVDQYSRQ